MADVVKKSKKLSEEDIKNINSVIKKINKISRCHDDAPDFDIDIKALEGCIRDDNPVFVKIVELVNNKIHDFFKNKSKEDITSEVLDIDEDIEAFFGDAIAGVDLTDEVKSRIMKSLQDAIDKRENRTKRQGGVRVKRLPKVDGDAAEVAAAIGLEDLAKALTVERPKPILTDVETDPNTGVTRHMRIVNKSEVERVAEEADLSGFMKEYRADSNALPEGLLSKDGLANALEVLNKYSGLGVTATNNKDQSLFEIIEELEGMVGDYTAEKLAADRRLRLARKALDEANAKLEGSNVSDILGALNAENLNTECAAAFYGRKF